MKSNRNRRWSSIGAVVIGLAVGVTGSAIAQDRVGARADGVVPANIAERRLDAPIETETAGGSQLLFKMTPNKRVSAGRNQVIVRLDAPSAAELGGNIAASKVSIQSEQAALIQRLRAEAPDLKVIAQTQVVLNAIFVEVSDEHLSALAEDVAVSRVAPIGDYELDLSDTVPYIGAAAAQAGGTDGSGVSIAVLDSGIDYTHANMGGPGTLEAYQAAWGTGIGDPTQTTRDGLFPTAKVVGGWDFVGEIWPFGPLAPDEDPIDFEGHGSHVADIAAGANGVAPGADLYAVKVCSAVSSSCSGIALIQGMEFSVDPNGDGDTSDAVDIINMSLGSTYGQAFDDDLSAAVDNATELGVFTVSSAGNCGDRPWCTGTPSSAPTALSVAQTTVPFTTNWFMEVREPAASAGIYDAVKYPWTPDPASEISGLVQYGDIDAFGDPTNLNGCAPFETAFPGRIVAVDRGGCFFSDKIRNIENAGGVLGIVMLIDDSAPFPGGFGGGPGIEIPGFNISRVDGDILRAGDAVVAFGPGLSEDVAQDGFTVASTARGPELSFVNLKPEIGAPGASVSLEAGTGTAETPFGGTSGASPMAAGSAALVQAACRDDDDDSDSDSDSDGESCSPLELKARLMNTAFRNVISDTTGDLAEITRIGGGEVRADAAVDAPFQAWSRDDDNPSISLGVIDGARDMTIKRKVRVENLTGKRQRIDVSNEDRNAFFAAEGAIEVDTRSRFRLDDDDSKTLNVEFNVDVSELNPNVMNSGSGIADPFLLGVNEIGGYLLMDSKKGQVAVPWHAIARQAAEVDPERQTVVPGGFPDTIGLVNNGVGTAQNDAYTIIGLSDEMPRGAKGTQSPTPDLRAVGVNTFFVPAGPFSPCSETEDSFIWVFAFNTWDRQSSLLPVIFQVDLDIDKDGNVDYFVYNAPLSILLFGDFSDPREVTWAEDATTGAARAFFFTEHATNTANTALTVCSQQIGMSPADLLTTNVDATARAFDFYFGGPGDSIDGITITPLGEGYFGLPTDIPGQSSGALNVLDFGPFPGNSPEGGVMLFTNGSRAGGLSGAATEDTEALLFLAPGVPEPAALQPPKMDHDDDSDSDSDSD